MIEVTAGIIIKKKRILIAKRKKGKHLAGYWEFPGGKMNVDESHEDCLRRELKEELNIEVSEIKIFAESIYDYPNKRIKLCSFIIRKYSGELEALDHEDLRWVLPADLLDYNLAPADIPIALKLLSL